MAWSLCLACSRDHDRCNYLVLKSATTNYFVSIAVYHDVIKLYDLRAPVYSSFSQKSKSWESGDDLSQLCCLRQHVFYCARYDMRAVFELLLDSACIWDQAHPVRVARIRPARLLVLRSGYVSHCNLYVFPWYSLICRHKQAKVRLCSVGEIHYLEIGAVRNAKISI